MKNIITSIVFSEKDDAFLVETSKDNFLIEYEDYEKLQLFVGKEISPELMQNLKNNRKLKRAKSVALKYLSYRPRATKEIRDRLRKDQFEETIIDETIYDLQNHEMINDYEFARIFYEDKIRFNHWSTKKINYELLCKGISRDIIDELTIKYSKYDYKNALFLVENKIKLWEEKYEEKYRLKNKIYSYLSSRGYDYSTIQLIFEEIM